MPSHTSRCIGLSSALALMLVACGSIPTIADAPDVAASAWLVPDLRASSVPAATVVVRRSTVFTLSICNVRIFVDGQGIVDVAPGERALLKVNPGTHIIGAEMPSAICPGRMREVSVNVVADKSTNFVIDVSPADGSFIFQPTAR